MTNVPLFGPQTPGATTEYPTDLANDRYGQEETWVRNASDGSATVLDAAFFNNIIGALREVVRQAGLTNVSKGDLTVLARAIAATPPDRLAVYKAADLPTASSDNVGATVLVTDAPGGATLAFCDGSSWRSAADKLIIA